MIPLILEAMNLASVAIPTPLPSGGVGGGFPLSLLGAGELNSFILLSSEVHGLAIGGEPKKHLLLGLRIAQLDRLAIERIRSFLGI